MADLREVLVIRTANVNLNQRLTISQLINTMLWITRTTTSLHWRGCYATSERQLLLFTVFGILVNNDDT